MGFGAAGPNRRRLIDMLITSRRAFLGVLAACAVPARATDALDRRLLARAMASFHHHRASVRQADIVAIADYSRPSRDRRFHLVDLASGRAASMLVAHGRGSDPTHSGWLRQFSNADGSNASCAGAFVTGDHYVGKHGRSMRLHGLDPSNDQALARAIVIHAAPYVSEAMARERGKVGRSQGCFALTEADLHQVLARLGGGRFLYADKV